MIRVVGRQFVGRDVGERDHWAVGQSVPDGADDVEPRAVHQVCPGDDAVDLPSSLLSGGRDRVPCPDRPIDGLGELVANVDDEADAEADD